MKSILIFLGIVLCTAILFWLDRRREKDRKESRQLYKETFNFLEQIEWNVSLNKLRGKYSHRELVDFRDQSGSRVLRYDTQLDGRDVSANYYFSEDAVENLKKVDLHISNFLQEDFDSLFRAIYQNCGSPMPLDENRTGSVRWDLKDKTLALEEIGRRTASLSLSRK